MFTFSGCNHVTVASMKRTWAIISVAALLVLGVGINNIGNEAPVVSSNGDAPAAADGGLASLGPVSLIDHTYTSSASWPCVRGAAAPLMDPVQCSQTADVSSADFDITGPNVSITSCAGANLIHDRHITDPPEMPAGRFGLTTHSRCHTRHWAVASVRRDYVCLSDLLR